MKTVVVIGGGASGLMAGCIASQNKENNVILIEKNEKLGKKIYITGKGRCNLSNYCSVHDFSSNIVNNSKFALHSLYSFSPFDTFNFFENNGLKLKIERGNRVFPVSEKASDVTKTLEKILHKNNVKTYLNTKVTDIFFSNDKITGVEINNKDFIGCDSIIICTGGISYPATGSTGDGYIFAEKASHTITPTRPALCGIELKGNDFLSLQGLSLKNVRLTVKLNGNVVFNEFGEMLFTHFGISGPIVLSCSSMINKYTGEKYGQEKMAQSKIDRAYAEKYKRVPFFTVWDSVDEQDVEIAGIPFCTLDKQEITLLYKQVRSGKLNKELQGE